MKILMIEDEKRMADAVCELLHQEGYIVDVKYDGAQGYDACIANIYDAIICDVMLPSMNGFDIVQSARANGLETPILMLTAKSDVLDKVAGLDCGADDYLTKPFQVEELLARLRALLRRNRKDISSTLEAFDLSLNTKSLTLSCTNTNKSIRLPEKEYKILECLLTNKEQIISKEQLTLKVWGYDNEAEYNNVEVYISFTRKKLKFLGSTTEIKSVRGMGYELRG
ncbi:DNA-binding response regulator, OmpR family, contains REC and winged-helix (wHTH) domain [Pseudobutyrivibrio sp. JW11]|uniref:response regulator transcription factor n=1 Tax=Pseudobutyrivibrio sp. JW11 TaxID=1855302 RepID=UPI0008F3B933|nr:response regulator transcription factor [Pseudobutyrivibrio sp. JW11]SFO27888.1 DNA-binding response regulator, OmpR family, contains REC and winged-helix (wHTH) domain [Pseudobutyrivibrio sp. JW11]